MSSAAHRKQPQVCFHTMQPSGFYLGPVPEQRSGGGRGRWAWAAWRHPGARCTYQRPQEHLGPWFKTTVVKSVADPLRRPLE